MSHHHDHPFVYDDRLLQECANSDLARRVQLVALTAERSPLSSLRSDDTTDAVVVVTVSSDDESCLRLFQQHARHFGRTSSSAAPAVSSKREELPVEESIRLRNFVRSVLFVRNHNDERHASSLQYRVGLNRFSDQRLDQILPAAFDEVDEEEDEEEELLPQPQQQYPLHDRRRLHDEKQQHRRHLLRRTSSSPFSWEEVLAAAGEEGRVETSFITLLSSHRQILDVAANLTIGKGGMNKLDHNKHKKKRRNKKLAYRDLYIPQDAQEDVEDAKHYNDRTPPNPFQAPDVSNPRLNGYLLSIKKKNKEGKHINHYYDYNADDIVDDDDDDDDDDDKVDYYEEEQDFTTYLNWATTDNPDGVPLVNDPIDQGTCGSCWAFVAAGSLEASAARSAALDAYKGFKATSSSSRRRHHRDESEEDEAMTIARRVEHDAMNMLNLSIQELIDCDTTTDQGCTGGNPILAFYFIHRYGLVSWKQYPYVGREEACKVEWTRHPLATVQSWGILTPNKESQMELVLRYIGPVAVGVNGGKDSFLSYSGGIYDNPHCKHSANHALLVVGYGQETDNQTGKSVKYWIARNSWGKGWGENGYVRIRRGHGLGYQGGVCGISRSPSVALGGLILGDHGLSKYQHATNKRYGSMRRDSLRPYSDKYDFDAMDAPLTRFCDRMGFSVDSICVQVATWFPQHKPLCFGVSGMLCFALALWLLTTDCRSRRRRQRQASTTPARQSQRRLSRASLVPVQEEQGEASPLLDTPAKPSYMAPRVY